MLWWLKNDNDDDDILSRSQAQAQTGQTVTKLHFNRPFDS